MRCYYNGIAGLCRGGACAVEPSIPNLYVSATDYQNNIPATDRFWYFRSSTGEYITEGGQHPAIEFDSRSQPVEGGVFPPVQGVVYPKNDTVTVRLRIRNENNKAVNVSLKDCGSELTADNYPYSWTLGTLGPDGTITIPANSDSTWIEFDALYSMYCVNLGNFSLGSSFYAKFIDEPPEASPKVNRFSAHTCRLYTVDSVPVGLQSVPWTDFLELSCKWAQWQEDESDVSNLLTAGARFSNHDNGAEFVYNSNLFDGLPSQYVQGTGRTSLYRTFRVSVQPTVYEKRLDLIGFLTKIYSSAQIDMDCRDFAACIALARESQGYHSKQLFHAPANYDEFVTSPLNPAPYPAFASYQPTVFSFHSTAATIDETNMFDASNCYELNLMNDTYYWPAAWWPLPDYWQKQSVLAYYLGLVRGVPGQPNAWVDRHSTDISAVGIVPGAQSNN